MHIFIIGRFSDRRQSRRFASLKCDKPAVNRASCSRRADLILRIRFELSIEFETSHSTKTVTSLIMTFGLFSFQFYSCQSVRKVYVLYFVILERWTTGQLLHISTGHVAILTATAEIFVSCVRKIRAYFMQLHRLCECEALFSYWKLFTCVLSWCGLVLTVGL